MPLRKYGITCNALVAGSNPAAGANDRIQKTALGRFFVFWSALAEKSIRMAFVRIRKERRCFGFTKPPITRRQREIPAAGVMDMTVSC